MPPFVGPPLVILAFVALWILVLNLIGYGCGWWALTTVYPHTGTFDGKLRRGRSLRLNSGNYNGGVTIGTNAEGLYLATFFLFRPGHPPLFIPWGDISAKIVSGWFRSKHLELTFKRAPGIRVQLTESLGKEIASDATLAWDIQKTADEDQS